MAQEPEENKGEVRVELGEVDAINNLDTARMALRWALERLHSLEKIKAELAESAELKTRLHAEAEGEKAALARTLAQKELDGRRRELYYQKLEEFVSLRLAGQLDARALIERDVETSKLLEFLQHRQATLEKEYAAKREDLEREYQRLRVEAAQESSRRLQEEELGLAQRRKALEKEHLSKGSELRERESVLGKEELSLEERRSRFSEFYKSQRAELDEGFRDLQEEAAERADVRVRKAEEQYQRRLSEKEAAWTLERDTLSTALSEWRRKAEELFALTQEFERRTAAAEEASALARKTADFERTRREESQRAAEAEKGALVPSLELWKAKAQEHIARANDLERKIATVEAELVKARDRISNGEAHLESLQSSWEQESLMLSSELHQWKRKAEEQLERALESGRRLEAAQAEMKLAQTAAESERARSDARLQEWEQERTGLLAEQARLTQENSSLKARAEERFFSILELEKKVSSLEEMGKLAQNAAESERSQLEARRAEWEQERTGLLAEQARLIQENSSWKIRAEEQLSRTLALGQKLDAAEAETRLLQAAVQSERANLEARIKSWDQEKAEALKERGLLSSQSENLKRLMEEQSTRRMELERQLFESQETLAQARNALEIQEAQLQAQSAGWESEKAALRGEAEMLSGRIKEGKAREEQLRARFMDAERRLFETEESLCAARTEGERLRAHLESERAAWEIESAELLRERDILLAEVEDWRRKHQERLSKTLDLERDLAQAKEEAARAPGPARIENAQLKARLESWEKEKAALFPELEQWRRKADEQSERSLSLEQRLVAAQEELTRARRPAELRQAQLEGEREAFTLERAALSRELEEWKEKSREQLARSLELDRRLAAAREEALHAQSAAERHQERHAVLETRWAQEISRLLLELHVNQKKMQDQFHLMMDLEARVASAEQAAATATAPVELKNAALEAQRQAWEAEKAVLLPQLDDWKARAQAHFNRLTELETRLAAAQTELAEAVEPGRLHDAQWEGRRAAWEAERAALLAERAGLSSELEDSRRRSLEIQSQVLELERKLAASMEEAQHAQSAAERQKERHASLETRWAREISGLLLELHAGGEKTRSQFETILDLEKRLTASEEENQKLKSSPAALKNERLEERRKALEDEKAGLILELTQWRQMADEHAAKTLELERKLVIAEQELGRSRQAAAIEEARLQAQRQALEEERSRLAPELEKWRREAAQGAERLAEIERELAAAREEARGGLRPLKAENSALESRTKALESERDTLVSEMDFWKTKTEDQSRRLLELEKTLASLQEEAESHASLRREKTAWEAQRKGWDQERAALAAERECLDLELQRWRANAQEHLGRSEGLSRKLSAAQEGERSARDEAGREREKARQIRAEWEEEKAALLEEQARLFAAASDWRKRALEHGERRGELERSLAETVERSRGERLPLETKNAQLEARRDAWEREKELLTHEQERFKAEMESWRLKAQDHLAKAQGLAQKLSSSEKAAQFAESSAQLEHAQIETLRELWETEKALLNEDQAMLASELRKLKASTEENASKLHETELKLARAEEEAAQAKRPLQAKTARLEAQRQAWEAEKAALLQDQARLASENELWRAKAQDHSARSQELAHRLADADKAAELARSAAQIEHAQAERLREIWEADKKLLLQDHLLLTSDLLELKGRSESHYSESRELERALAAARSELEQARRPLEAETVRHEAERAAWEAERESLVHSHDSLRAELERWRGQAKSHRERLAELDSALALAQEELASRDSPLQRKTEELEARRSSWENERASLLQEGKRLGSELESWKLKAQEQLTRSQELGQKLRTAENAAESARGAADIAEHAVELQRTRSETQRRLWEAEKASLLPALERWKAAAEEQSKRTLEFESRLTAAEEEKTRLQGLSEAKGARLESDRAALLQETRSLREELDAWRNRLQEQTQRSLEIERKLAAAQEAALHAESSSQRHQERHASLETQWAREIGRLLQELRQSQDKARSQSDLIADLERRLDEAAAPPKPPRRRK